MSWIRRIFQQKRRNKQKNSLPVEPLPSVETSNCSIVADNPITQEEDDALGRSKQAKSFAEQILALDSGEGAVVGVLGPWGSGKTSFINLARRRLKESDVTILEFNPWMFSGADQLVQTFFIELSSQLKVRPGLNEIGKRLEDYGETFSGLGWLPLVGPWIEGGRAAANVLAKLLQRRKQGVRESQSRVRESLLKLEKPIIVILDDIDRLTTSEIRDVFKLVRLTANFPKVIYLLAFDRNRVEQALGEQGIPGRDYLEKIIQIGTDLPAIPDAVLSSQITKAIDTALANVENPGPFDSNAWPDVFMEVIYPLIRNMRDVRRYAASIHGTVRDLGGQVALVDILALEAIRIFLPDVFRCLHAALDGLTVTTEGFGSWRDSPHLKEQIETLIKSAGERGELVRNLVRRLFPGGQRHVGGSHYGGEWKNRWLRERRVAHGEVLHYYLERVAGERLQAFTDAEKAWAKIGDQAALEAFMQSLPVERLQDVISSLEAYEDQFSPDHVVPAAVVLLNLLPRLPERRRGFYDLDTRLVVTRVVYRIVRTLKEPRAVDCAVQTILLQVVSLSSKLELITIVGHQEGVGHKLASEDAAKAFEKNWRAEVRAASPEALAQEADLLRTLLVTKKDAGPDEPSLDIHESPDVTYALLKSARHEARSQSMDSRAVHVKPRLAWDVLVEIYGDEVILRHRIEALKTSLPKNIGDLMELTDKYLAGWRPKPFGDE